MFKASFLANQVVSDTELNAIGYNLANTVYTSFANDVTYGIEDLNQITANIVGPGVKRGAGENCSVSLSGTTVKISSGIAFFASGVTMAVDDDGISLELEDNSKTNYVYLFYNPAVNVVGARCTTEMPSGLEYVLLAEISEKGEIFQNTERYCKSKIYDAPNTPLVIYNTLVADGIQIIHEKIYVHNLKKYGIARITFANGYSYEYGGHWYRWDPYTVFIDFDTGCARGIYASFPAKGWDDEFGFAVSAICGNPLGIGLWQTNNRKYLSGYINLEFDFENNSLILTARDGVEFNANDIKIELYAGEVQELEEL